ncbi:glutaminyl cyclase [Pseudovirgaria hyperparasitica]|uniref:Peptide hydrolase n=1 Tax=Pseudovirgaria hyperparasitica TaxID=470096 RepID=A0A6A6VXK9_9PEZI|nr:glutaminyl cyclase [Pseudovirgaria hyperparasitica]KAF2754963.1 glutaminyl cyclase [Pseudovirgaria hyperparasitica]
MRIMLQRSLLCLTHLLGTIFAYTPLSDDSLKSLPGPGDDFDIKTGTILSPILKVRVPGTEGITAVQHHFINFFQNTLPEWHLELHNSTATTPLSKGEAVPFVNIIATRDPPWARPGDVGRLALVAHYDSKITPEGFIGATDSAAPVAMIMHAVRSVDQALTKRWKDMQENGDWQDSLEPEKGVQVLLLDGEEAFVSWSATDSLYGARALAESWDGRMHTAASTYHNFLDSIELFLLLDLLGSKEPQIPSYFKTTHWAYKAMAALEMRLRDMGEFKSSPNHHSKRKPGDAKRKEKKFLHEADKDDSRFMGGFVQDDHVPFMARGVEILHIIPTPFPRVWHEMTDDGEHLDMDTVEDWAKLVTAFVSEWMDLEGYFEHKRDTEEIAQLARKGENIEVDEHIRRTEL